MSTGGAKGGLNMFLRYLCQFTIYHMDHFRFISLIIPFSEHRMFAKKGTDLFWAIWATYAILVVGTHPFCPGDCWALAEVSAQSFKFCSAFISLQQLPTIFPLLYKSRVMVTLNQFHTLRCDTPSVFSLIGSSEFTCHNNPSGLP